MDKKKKNEKLSAVPEPATVALADRIRHLKEAGRRIVALQTGDPDFETPEIIAEAACRAIREGETHYSHSRGLPSLRNAIVAKLAKENGVKYDPEREVLVTCGGVHAYHCSLCAILSSGDTVLVPDPAWMTHSNMVLLMGGIPVRVPTGPESNFFPSVEALELSVAPSTRALVINSPNNPTGMVATRDYLMDVLRFAERHDLYVISDEVYEYILFDGPPHYSFGSLPGAKKRTILVNSFSKSYAMTGWRIGYLAAPEKIISQALKVSQHSITNLPPFIQKAALTALSDPDVQPWVEQMVLRYRQRRDMALRIWEDFGRSPIKLIEPKGTFYMLADIKATGLTSLATTEALLNDRGIAMVPGSTYGSSGEGYLRLTLAAADEDVRDGIQGLLKWSVGQ